MRTETSTLPGRSASEAGKSSLSSVQDALSSAEGFILIDVLIAVMIISLCAGLISQTASFYRNADGNIHRRIEETEENYRSVLSGTPECIICEEVTGE